MPMNREAARSVLAQNLRALMDQRGWKQTELASRSGVSQAAISAILRCKKAPTVDTVEAFSRALGVEPWQLLMPGLSLNPSVAIEVVGLLRQYQQASTQGRDMIARIAAREAELRP